MSLEHDLTQLRRRTQDDRKDRKDETGQRGVAGRARAGWSRAHAGWSRAQWEEGGRKCDEACGSQELIDLLCRIDKWELGHQVSILER